MGLRYCPFCNDGSKNYYDKRLSNHCEELSSIQLLCVLAVRLDFTED